MARCGLRQFRWDDETVGCDHRKSGGHSQRRPCGRGPRTGIQSRREALGFGDNDSALQGWDPTSGREVGKPTASHIATVLGAAFSADVGRVAVARGDGTVWVLDASTGEQVGAALTGHTGPVNAVAFSPDGKLLASAGDDATVRLWDLVTHAAVRLPVLSGHAGPVDAVRSAPTEASCLRRRRRNRPLVGSGDGQRRGYAMTGHTGRLTR